MPSKNGFKAPSTPEELQARGFDGYYTIVGDHTQRAMNLLHQRYKKNPAWMSLSAIVYVVHRSAENYSHLKSWGIMDNIKGEKRVVVSFLDKVTALHEDYLSLKEHENSAGHREWTQALKEQRRRAFGGISAGSS